MAIALPSQPGNLLSGTAITATSYISLVGLIPSDGTGIVLKNIGSVDVFVLGGLGQAFTVAQSGAGAYRLGAGACEEFTLPGSGIDNLGIRTAAGSSVIELAIGRGVS